VTYSEPSLEPIKTEENQPEITESEAKIEDSMAEYYQVKQTLLLGTLIFILVCFPICWKFYTLNIALNYLLGGCFSLVYLNMLAREVERLGTNKRRLGFTRLALFVGLIIVASQIQQLKVIPIFFGFLTYKFTLLFYILPSSLLKSAK
jgi:ATP synthase protein I